jgi:uncharacterized damage-inducible protein DinB
MLRPMPHDHQEFLKYFDGVRGRTLRVARCIPADRLEWRPAPDAFSFGDLLRHLAGIERWMFAENIAGRPASYAGHGPELAEGLEAVLAYLDRLHAESMAIFAGLTEADLARRVITPAGVPITAWKWLRSMVEHEAHHRGQIYTMLRLIGVATPPIYGLTEPEVVAKSRSI